MKIKFIKDYGEYKQGDIIECGKTRALRFEEQNIAVIQGQVKEEKKAVVTKEMKTPIKTKAKTKN